MDNENIREWLRKLTKDPHVGGTPEEEVYVAGLVEDHMRAEGLTVKVSSYDVLLSYPKREEGLRNYVAIHDKNGEIKIDKNV